MTKNNLWDEIDKHRCIGEINEDGIIACKICGAYLGRSKEIIPQKSKSKYLDEKLFGKKEDGTK